MQFKITLLFLLLFFVSCGQKKSAFDSEIKEKSTGELVDRLDELSNLNWDFLTAKTTVKLVTDEQSNSFKASLRMKRDSAMLVNISFAGIPIVQSILSNDSLKLVNRKDKCYKFQDRSALDQVLDFPIEYYQLQDLLIGKPLIFNKEQEHIQISNKAFYEIKTKRKRAQNSIHEIFITYYLFPTSLELSKVRLESPADEATMEITYIGKHEKIDGLVLPQEIDIVLKNKGKTSAVNISYNKPDISHEKKITLNVPENYATCP